MNIGKDESVIIFDPENEDKEFWQSINMKNPV